MNCPFRNFEECPEHNKKNGCSFWIAYTTNKDSLEAHIEGCSITLTPLLLLESANNLGHIAGEISKVGSEISYSRCENIKNGEATREQLCSLASGNLVKIHPNYNDIPLQLENKKV